MVEHTTRAFDTDLQELATKIADMGRLDDEQIADATEALVKRDTTLAGRVIAADDRVDTLQRDIEEKAVTPSPDVSRWRLICGRSWERCAFPMILSGSVISPRTSPSE